VEEKYVAQEKLRCVDKTKLRLLSLIELEQLFFLSYFDQIGIMF
jgi:hypothetical protein